MPAGTVQLRERCQMAGCAFVFVLFAFLFCGDGFGSWERQVPTCFGSGSFWVACIGAHLLWVEHTQPIVEPNYRCVFLMVQAHWLVISVICESHIDGTLNPGGVPLVASSFCLGLVRSRGHARQQVASSTRACFVSEVCVCFAVQFCTAPKIG